MEERRKRKEAAEIAREGEEAKNLPADYFDGWHTYTIQKGDCIVSNRSETNYGRRIKGTFIYALEMEVVKNNDRQLPFKGHSIVQE